MNRFSRHTLHLALPVALFASVPLIGQAADGPYVGVEGGVNWENPQDLWQGGTFNDRLHFNTGWDAGLMGGYSFANGLRPELELDHRSNGLNRDELGNDEGTDRADSALANLWYDFKAASGLFSVLHPYLGVGVGAVRSYYHGATLGGFPIDDDYATEFGYQVGAGLGYDLTPHLTLSVDYRRLWTNRGSFPVVVNPPLEQRYRAQTALLSVRYSFGAPPAAATAVTPEPPPPPPPPSAPPPPPPPPVATAPPPCNPPAGFKVDANCHIIDQTVIVRAVDFEFNSVRLTAPAQRTLDQVASALAAQPELKVEIQGYADSTGSDAYNLKLSQRRAEAVEAYVISKGVDPSTLTAHGYGNSQPLASNDTAEGRAQNRRVSFEVTNSPPHVKLDSEQATPASTEAAEQDGRSKAENDQQ